MNRFIFTLLAVLLPVSAVYAQDDCSNVTSSLGMVHCSEAAKKSADTQLNASYKQLMARLESDYRADPALGAEYAAKVKESQRAWLKLRDANCPLEEFAPFLTAFSANSESQRRLTALTVKSLVLKPVAGKERSTFEPLTSGGRTLVAWFDVVAGVAQAVGGDSAG